MPGTSNPIRVYDANDNETLGNSLTFAGTLTLPAVVDASALPTSAGAAGTLWVDNDNGGVLTVASA